MKKTNLTRKGRPFRNVVKLSGLPNGKVAYLHATKGWRNRRPTPQLLVAMMGA